MENIDNIVKVTFLHNIYDDFSKGLIPFKRGIYIAFSGRFNGRHVELNRLLYIGMACERSISECIHDHTVNHHDKWIADHCKKNENIYYRVANLESGIQEAWFSLINRLNPPCNSLKSRDFNDNCLIHNINIDFSDIDS